MNVTDHWDIFSLMFYLTLAFIGACSFYAVKQRERKSGNLQKLTSKEYLLWALSWATAAACRYVSSTTNVGGTDAYSYAIAFEQVFNPGSVAAERLKHYGIAWQWLCKILNFICDNYHFFFFVTYLIIIVAIIYFLNSLALKYISATPIIAVFYLFLRGFNTLRTEFSIAMLLFGLVFLWKKKYIKCGIFCALSVLFQTASLLYICFIPFYVFFKKKGLTVKHGVILTVGGGVVGYLARYLLTSGIIKISYYSNYAAQSLTSSFFASYWKIVFSQMLLAVAILIIRKRIFNSKRQLDDLDLDRFNFIWAMCIFDICTIPITYFIHLWRGYEYFYVARVIMWGYMLTILRRKSSTQSKQLFTIMGAVVFTAWTVFCIWNNWSSSGLMPYVFAPFSSL